MRLPEQRFWDRTRARLQGEFRLERIENLAGVGTPDVLATARATGRTTLIELKAVVELPKRATSKVLGRAGLNQDQKNWHMDFVRAKGQAFILVGIGPYRQLLIEGRWADHINDWNFTEMNIHAIAFDWLDIKNVLTNEKPE